MKRQDRYDARVRVVKAMAHPTRMFIVDELSRSGERCVCELTEMVGADISTVSNTWRSLRMWALLVMINGATRSSTA